MLEINLLPVREARRKADLRQYFMQLVLVLIVVCGGVGLFHSRLIDQINRTEARVAQMQSDIDKFAPQLQQVEAFKKRKSELQKKIDIIDGLDKARAGPVRVLYEVASRTPDRLWLTSMSTKARQIKFQGQSLDNELVAVFLRKLGESDDRPSSPKEWRERMTTMRTETRKKLAEILTPGQLTAYDDFVEEEGWNRWGNN